ncbi:tautomerase family protein [Rhizobiaceae bacterium n13]|uniref:Tautomerase family protein n=1 Tax=Ferirhizobium litorale TaxID=2927786 RepID=A0AAE3QDD4_9HYPH|nr:tautomerase family protein [Fererhizobium litorale]MDI7865137.1 tautomerase family protein [Fererhizobium litorale]MDI7922891.1 tautomerase family protein [Fererhizobium litorale]
MPIMNVHYVAGHIDDGAKADLATRLTEVLIKMEGGANTHGGRAFAWVIFTEIARTDFWVGGARDDTFIATPGPFLVHVTIPEGYMNAGHKSEVHAWVNDAILATLHARDAHKSSILVVIDEVPEGNWGAAGQTISLESIADAVGMSKSGGRFSWVRSYFDAKQRMLSAFDYPHDMGGLPPSMSAQRPGRL